jgi:molecular chaperone DnaK
MKNNNIAIGIDLGTTNSSVAINVNGKIQIIKKPGGVEYTPSVFGFDKSCNKVVGQKAYEYLYKYNSKDENKNFKAEVKRIMGTPENVFFERPNLTLSPEEISAEIIKSLKEDILRKYPDFQTNAAVITVPASFYEVQRKATKKAGNLAGFDYVVLLQEPIAAAISYGFMKTKNENWIIYDLGGGTFDVALVSCNDGLLSVLGNNGDNFLGGKNVDWEIVDTIIKPKILDKYNLTDFTRGNPKYSNIFSRLKYYAETAKIELSQYDKTTINIEEVGKDESDKEIYLSVTVNRQDIEKILKTKIDQTIKLTKDTLKEAGIKSSSVAKIILVGGPTLIPYVRERLEKDLKIKVDSSVDPLTVVARGACIYALSQTIPAKFLESGDKKTDADTYNINLNYVKLTSDNEESVTGNFENLDKDGEYYIQIQSESGTFTGPKIKLKDNKFYYKVKIEPNKQNLYWIYLFDNKGNSLKLSQDSFTITHGLSVPEGAPITHSIKVVVASRDISNNKMINTCEMVFEKGSILPLKNTLYDYKTSRKLKKGDPNPLDIEIREGESEKPDRNNFLCKIGIPGEELPHDLPAGTPIELCIEMDSSGVLEATAYIPLIDMHFNARSTVKDEALDIKKMSKELEEQRERTESILEECSVDEREKIEGKFKDIDDGIDNSNIDEDERGKTANDLKNMKILLDEIEEEKGMQLIIKDYNILKDEVQKIIDEYANPQEKEEFNTQLQKIKLDGNKAIEKNSKALLKTVFEQLWDLRQKAIYSNPATWVDQFKQIVEYDNFINEKEAQYYINKGMRAIETEDIDELKRCTQQLYLLLPIEEQKKIKLSGITR